MDEARFVLKCFAFAAIVLVVSQVKTKSGGTIENQIQATLVSSEMASFVNKAADGGAQLIKDGAVYLKAKMNKNSTAKDNSGYDDQGAVLQEQAILYKQQAVKKIEELNEQIQTAISQKKEKPILFEDELIEEIE